MKNAGRFAVHFFALVFSLLTLLSRLSFCANGTAGATFLDIPVGGRPAAMGSAYSALAVDAYAPIWNPAGLGFVDTTQVAAQHLSYLESVNYEQASFAEPLGYNAAFGASLQYLGSGDIAATDSSGASLGSFSSHFVASNVSFGKAITPDFALGMTGKWINEKISDVSANAYAFDFGSMYHPDSKSSLAVTLTNVGNKLTFLSEGDNLPTSFHVGGAYQFDRQWLLSAEGAFPFEGTASGRTGIEWSPVDFLSLRAGYRSDTLSHLSSIAGFSTGIGVHVWGQEFSYAWVPYGDLGDTQYFSLLIKFGASSEPKNLQEIKP